MLEVSRGRVVGGLERSLARIVQGGASGEPGGSGESSAEGSVVS